MYHRSIALVALLCFVLGESGCASWKITRIENPESKKDYQEVVMPLQTGSVLHRRTYVRRGPETKKKSSAKKQKSSAKPEAEPSPTPEEESTPGADRFR